MLQDVNGILKSTQQLSEHKEDLFTHMGENGNYTCLIILDIYYRNVVCASGEKENIYSDLWSTRHFN